MRIAWTGPVGNGGGVPGMGRLMLEELLRQGVEVDVYRISYAWEATPIEPRRGLRIIARRSRWRWNRWYSCTKARALFTGLAVRSLGSTLLSVRLLIEHRRNPYDAIFQLSQTELFLLGRMRRFAPPIVVHPCTHAAGELRWHRAESAYALISERRVVHYAMRAMLMLRSRVQPQELARADLVIGPSERFIELVHRDYGLPRAKLRVLRHPVDLERFHANGGDTAAQPATLLFISRISTRKGVAEIIELSHRLADLSGSVRLVVVGGATQWSDYTRHLAGLNPDVTQYVGGVQSEDMPALLRRATMLLVPSRYEPGSIVTGEALASGLPVVLSDEVGPTEVVAGPHVRIHRAGDVEDLEASVRSLLSASADDEPALRASARANAEREFAADTIVSRLIGFISSVAGGAPVMRPLAGVEPDHRPTVTVCIPTMGRPEELARALASIERSTYPVAQVVVSDDRPDGTAEAVCRDASVEVDYVRGPGRGVGANRNRAIAAATGEVVAFLDDDGVLLPDFVETALARMSAGERRHGAGRVIVSGRSLTEHGELVAVADQTFLGHQSRPYASDEGLRSISLNAVIFPARLFAEIRFDPQLVYGYEEVDLASRAAAAGYVIVDCPEAVNYHESPPDKGDYHERYAEASRLHVTLRRYALTERAPLRALAFALIAPVHILAGDVRRLGVPGVRKSAGTIGLTARMLWRAR